MSGDNRILVVHTDLGVGGAEKMISFLVRVLSTAYNVTLMLLKDTPTIHEIPENVYSIKQLLYHEQALRSIGFMKAIKSFSCLVRGIRKQIKAVAPRAVVAFDLRIIVAVWLATRGTGVKTIFSERADPYENSSLWQNILRYIYPRSDGMVFQTEGARSFYPKLNKHVRIIPNPVLVEKDIPSVPPQFRRSCIVSVGRLQRRKGFDVLIDAFARVHRELPEYKLYIYGEGEERLALEAQIAAAGLQEAVFLPGIAIQILKKNRDIKLFVMPSRSEGIPNVLIEAMSEGIPCVSADCSPGGARLLLGDSYGGLLVPPDNADAMAEAMLKMLMNNEMAEQFAQRAQKSLSRFAVENIAEIWLSFFREILEEKTDGSFHKTCH